MGENIDKVKGRAKQAAGDLTGDEELRDEGRSDEQAGKVKGIVNDLKDKAEDAVDAVKDRVNSARDYAAWTRALEEVCRADGDPHMTLTRSCQRLSGTSEVSQRCRRSRRTTTAFGGRVRLPSAVLRRGARARWPRGSRRRRSPRCGVG